MTLLKELGPSVANMVVLVLVVKLFLDAQKSTRDSSTIERKEYVEKISDLHKEHMLARAETRDVLSEVAKAMHEVSLAIETCPLKKHH